MQRAFARSMPSQTWLVAAFGAAFCALASHVGADARWFAAVGAAILRTGGIPHSVPYASAPALPWHDVPALGQLVFHALEVVLGDKGLILAQVAAVAIALSAVALDLKRAEARDGAGAAVLAACVVAAPASFLVARAELFSLALFPLLVLLLRTEARRKSRRIWLAVPLLVLWANLHGGALIGFAVLAAYLVLQRARRDLPGSLSVLAASAGALVVATPALLHTVDYYAGVLRGEAATGHYGLWAPLSFRDPLDVLFVALALPLLVAALRRRPELWEVAVLVGLAALTVEAHRNGLWLVLFAATPAARAFGRAIPRAGRPRRAALVCLTVPAAMLLIALMQPVPVDGAGEPLLRRTAAMARGTPILAEPVAAEQLALRGDQIWIGNPLDAFAQRDQRLYLDWLRGRPAGDLLLRGPSRVVLAERGSPAQQRLAVSKTFRELARDSHAVLYTRRG
jgi:hypothetical protein